MKLLSILKLLIAIWNINTYKYKYKIKSYCLKCRKDTENINPKVSKTSTGRKPYYQNVQYVVVKNHDLLKIKKQKDY